MDLQEFRMLESPERLTRNAARIDWIANIILGQHPRLRRGDDMQGPVGIFKNGKNDPVDGRTINELSITVTEAQLNFHPWLDLNVIDQNYLHMRSVILVSPFNDVPLGTPVDFQFRDRTISVPLTQEMIDQTTMIIAKFGLSQ